MIHYIYKTTRADMGEIAVYGTALETHPFSTVFPG